MAWLVGFISGGMVGVITMALVAANNDREIRLREATKELEERSKRICDVHWMYQAEGMRMAIKIMEGRGE